MDKIPLGLFILQSFPESFIVITIGLIMIGIKPDFKRIVLLAMSSALFSYLVRSSPIVFGLHSLLHLSFLVIITRFVLRIPLFQVILAALLGVLTLGIAEVIFMPLLMAIYGFALPAEQKVFWELPSGYCWEY